MAFLLKMPTFWRSRRLQVYILRLEMMMFIAIPPHTRREISKEIESPVFHSFPPNVSKRGYHSTIYIHWSKPDFGNGSSTSHGIPQPKPSHQRCRTRLGQAFRLGAQLQDLCEHQRQQALADLRALGSAEIHGLVQQGSGAP